MVRLSKSYAQLRVSSATRSATLQGEVLDAQAQFASTCMYAYFNICGGRSIFHSRVGSQPETTKTKH